VSEGSRTPNLRIHSPKDKNFLFPRHVEFSLSALNRPVFSCRNYFDGGRRCQQHRKSGPEEPAGVQKLRSAKAGQAGPLSRKAIRKKILLPNRRSIPIGFHPTGLTARSARRRLSNTEERLAFKDQAGVDGLGKKLIATLLRALELQRSVQAAGAVALEVEGHVEIAELLKTANDLVPGPVLDHLRKLLGLDFDARDRAMMTDTQLSEPELAQRSVRLLTVPCWPWRMRSDPTSATTPACTILRCKPAAFKKRRIAR